MNLSQRFSMSIRGFMKMILSSASYADMERESRAWFIQCSNCEFEKSVWDSGGIRWKAAGNPRMNRLCGNCQQLNWHVVYKKENF